MSGEKFWQLRKMSNAFNFFIIGNESSRLFLEYDELAAVGPAYENKNPWCFLDVLRKLETLVSGYSGIIISDSIRLIRIRDEHCPGLLLEISGTEGEFLKDDTLNTLNFLDFYEKSLLTETGGVNEQKITGNEKNSGPDLQISGNQAS